MPDGVYTSFETAILTSEPLFCFELFFIMSKNLIEFPCTIFFFYPVCLNKYLHVRVRTELCEHPI